MNEKEIDEEIKRLKEKERIDKKKKQLDKLKEKHDPSITSKINKLLKKL